MMASLAFQHRMTALKNVANYVIFHTDSNCFAAGTCTNVCWQRCNGLAQQFNSALVHAIIMFRATRCALVLNKWKRIRYTIMHSSKTAAAHHVVQHYVTATSRNMDPQPFCASYWEKVYSYRSDTVTTEITWGMARLAEKSITEHKIFPVKVW